MKKKVTKTNLLIEAIVVSALLFLCFILRLIYLSHLRANDPNFYNPAEGTDMLTYHNFAKQILSGTFTKEPYYYGPLYYYFLAFIYKITGANPLYPKLFQMMLGTATSLLIYLIARNVFNRSVALISLIISVFYGMFYIHEGVLLMASLSTFLTTLSIFLLLKNSIILSGITIGLSALCRANILLFVPFILIWLIQHSQFNIQHSLKRFGLLCLTILLTISPVTIRNYLVSGRFVLISTNGPINLWIGNNPYAEGWFAYPPSEYSDKITRKAKERGDIAFVEEVVRFAREYPAQFTRLFLKKLLLFWDKTEIVNNINYELQKELSWVLKISFLSFGIIAPLALFGIFLSLRRPSLLHLFILSFMLASITFFITARHRMPIVPILICFSGFAIFWLYEKAKTKNIKALSLSLISLLFFFSLTHSRTIEGYLAPYLHPDGFCIALPDGAVLIRDNRGIWQGERKITLTLPKDGVRKELIIKENLSEYQEAVVYFRCAVVKEGILLIDINDKERIPIKPMFTRGLTPGYRQRFIPTALKKGVNSITIRPLKESNVDILIDDSLCFGRSQSLDKDGKWKRLERGELMVWLSLHPKSSAISWAVEYMNRGIIFRKEKLYDEAIYNLKQATRLDPNLKKAYHNLGIAYYGKQIYEMAIDNFKKALKIDHNYPDAHYGLGACYEKMGRLDDAIREYERVIELERDKESLIKTHDNLIRIYYAKGMWNKILEHSKEIVKIDPSHIAARKNIATVHFKRREFEKAEAEAQKVLELDPNNTYAKQMLAECRKILDTQKGISVK